MAPQSISDVSLSAPRRTIHAQDPMQIVRSALRQSEHRFHRESLKQSGKWIPAFIVFFCALLFLQIGIASIMALRSMDLSRPIVIEIADQAGDGQIQLFLQALLHLPQVARVEYVTPEKQMHAAHAVLPERSVNMSQEDFHHRAEVYLRSDGSFASFVRFLERPELSAVLASTALWDVVSSSMNRRDAFAPAGVLIKFAWIIIVGASAILIIYVWIYTRQRVSELHRSIRLMKLFGSNMQSMQREIGIEMCAMLIVALGLSLIVMGAVTSAYGAFSMKALSVTMVTGSFVLCILALTFTRFAIQRS